MNAARVVRDAQAKSSALRSYALMHDRFAEAEQLLLLEGREIEADDARVYAERVLRAWRAEDANPTPKGLPA